MKRAVRLSLFGVAILLVIIQFIPVDRMNPPVVKQSELQVPGDVMDIFRKSCFDCHSNQTNWPFYSYVAPVSWLVAHDVEEGREKFNFSEWQKLTEAKKRKLQEEIAEEISEDEMPLWIYLIMHPQAELTEQQKQTVMNWSGKANVNLHEDKEDNEDHDEEKHREEY
ncbi:MAG: heme-binding domain-containing protein [bacterium]